MRPKPALLYSILLVAIVTLTYRGGLNGGFIRDDRILIEENDFIRDADNLPALFSREYFERTGELTYRPVCTASYFLDHALWKANPFGWHLSNIVLHAVNVLLLFYLLNLLFEKGPDLPFFGAVLFGVHPALSEAVFGVTYREDLLCLFFSLLSLICWNAMRRSSRSWEAVAFATASGANYCLALFSKETAAVLPVAVLLFEQFRGEGAGRAYRRRPYYYFGMGLVLAFYLYVRFWSMGNPGERLVWHGGGPADTAATMTFCFMKYLQLAAAPVRLCGDYAFRIAESFFEARVLLSCLGAAAFAALTLKLRKISAAAAFGLAWFALFLTPVLNIVPIATLMNERYLYAPAAGFALFLAALLFDPGSPGRRLALPVRRAAAILIAGIFAAQVIQRAAIWRDAEAFWTDTAACAPNSAIARVNLGQALIEANDESDEALRQLDGAVRLAENARWPDRHGALYKAYGNRAVAHARAGLVDRALQDIQAALQINPLYDMAMKNDQIIYLNYRNRKEYLNVIRFYEDLASRDPNNVPALSILGRHMFYQRDFAGARKYFNRALQSAPDDLVARSYLDLIEQHDDGP